MSDQEKTTLDDENDDVEGHMLNEQDESFEEPDVEGHAFEQNEQNE